MHLPFIRLCLVTACLCLCSTLRADTPNDRAKQLLTHPLTPPAKQIEALQDYLDETAFIKTPTSLVLKSHARLQLAALLLQQGNNEESRSTLMALPQNSPVAVPAALLLAQSWLTDSNHQEALQWYLRTIQRYPYHPQALEGLLDAAELLQGSDMQSALTLCDKATQNSLQAIQQLQQLLELTQKYGLPALIDKQAVIDPAIQRQLMETTLFSAESSLFDNDRQARRFTEKYRQLLSQLHALQQTQADTTNKMRQLDQAILLLKQRMVYEEKQIETIKNTLNQTSNDSHVELRKRLVQLNNSLKIDEAQLNFLEQNRNVLPTISARLHSKLVMLLKYAAQQQQIHVDSFTSSIKTSGEKLNAHWHNIAARGQLLKADMLRATATHYKLP